MSLLLDHGHPEARHYPLGMVWDESNLVIERVNSVIITEANLLQHGVNSILSKESGKLFKKMIADLNVQTVPFTDNEDTGGNLDRLLPEGYEKD